MTSKRGRGMPGQAKRPSTQAPPEATSSDGEITIFLSYSRSDERVYRMVRHFKELLGHFIHAKSRRKVRTFLDQDSIGWGEIWEERLDAEILGASVFIPLLSANYLESEMCRREFNRFQSKATSLGVKELLLPVLLLEAPAVFDSESEDEVVRVSSALQWEIIEDAVLSDVGSSEWKRTMSRLADRFVIAYQSAEETLGTGMAESATLPEIAAGAPRSVDLDDELDQEGPGLAELFVAIDAHIARLTSSTLSMRPAIESFGSATSIAGKLPPKPSAKQIQAWSIRSAAAFKEPALDVDRIGEEMLDATKELDQDLQQLRRLAESVLTVSPEVARGYNRMLNQLSGLDEVGKQLEGLLSQMKPAEAFSVPLRQALRPARRGLTKVMDSLSLIQGWQQVQMED